MTRAHRGALILAAAALLVAAAFAVTRSHEPSAARAAGKPKLLLLTSLPLVFGEQFSLEGAGSPALKALQSRYRVEPISVTSERELANSGLLLLAHPPAQAAENLVALDEWLRRGGRLLLLADPMLEWPSSRPLGDRLRPAPMFMDLGLLQHWGLRLDAPDKRGPEIRRLGGYEVLTESPGVLSGKCAIGADRLVAQCRIGNGRAIVVADADLLDTQDLGPGASHNLDGLLSVLESLQRS
jgi:hypothetical protein